MADSTPTLVANPLGKTSAASDDFQSARTASSSVWTGREPLTSREAPAPAPHFSIASCAAASTLGCAESPR